MKTKHDAGCGMAFGRPVAGTMCPRCRELAGGAAPRKWSGLTRMAKATLRCDEVRAHFASERHQSGGCGPVCTFGEW